MKFKKKGNIALWFYQYNLGSDDSYPKPICPLFWGSILGFVLFILSPITSFIITPLMNIASGDRPYYGANNTRFVAIVTWLINILIFIVGVLGWEVVRCNFYAGTTMPLYVAVLSVFFVPGLLLFICGVVWGGCYVFDNLRSKSGSKEPSVIIEGVKSIKNKVCPIIEWD